LVNFKVHDALTEKPRYFKILQIIAVIVTLVVVLQ
jgi:hypothetical protein